MANLLIRPIEIINLIGKKDMNFRKDVLLAGKNEKTVRITIQAKLQITLHHIAQVVI